MSGEHKQSSWFKVEETAAEHDMKTVEAGAGGNWERVFDMKTHLFLSE